MESINNTFFWWITTSAVGCLGVYILLIAWSIWKGKETNTSLRERIRLKNLCNNLKTLKTTTHAEMRKWKAYR